MLDITSGPMPLPFPPRPPIIQQPLPVPRPISPESPELLPLPIAKGFLA